MRSKLASDNTLLFECPGCDTFHGVNVTGAIRTNNEPIWDWNGLEELPTISPSILIYASGNVVRCHSFVKDGRIQYLSDCGHKLAGQTVDIPEWS